MASTATGSPRLSILRHSKGFADTDEPVGPVLVFGGDIPLAAGDDSILCRNRPMRLQ
jgi:hypothetical protein